MPEPQHCAICHWLQSLQTVVRATVVAAPSAEFRQLFVTSLSARCSAAAGWLAARAPPQA
jgi:hypothetical protein